MIPFFDKFPYFPNLPRPWTDEDFGDED